MLSTHIIAKLTVADVGMNITKNFKVIAIVMLYGLITQNQKVQSTKWETYTNIIMRRVLDLIMKVNHQANSHTEKANKFAYDSHFVEYTLVDFELLYQKTCSLQIH